MSASTCRVCARTAATIPSADRDDEREVAADQRADQLVQLLDRPVQRRLLVVLHRLVVDRPEPPRQRDGDPEHDRGGDREDEVADATRAPQPPRDRQRDRDHEHLDRECGAHREPGCDRAHDRGVIAVGEREPRRDRGERDRDAVAGDRSGGPQHGAGRRGQPAGEPGAPARRAEATARGPHRERHRDAGQHRRDAWCVQRAETEQISRVEDRQVQRSLRREHLVERPRAVPHREHRGAVDPVVVEHVARREEHGEPDDQRQEREAGGHEPDAAHGACARRRSGHGHRKKVGGGCTDPGAPRGRFVRAPDAVRRGACRPRTCPPRSRRRPFDHQCRHHPRSAVQSLRILGRSFGSCAAFLVTAFRDHGTHDHGTHEHVWRSARWPSTSS